MRWTPNMPGARRSPGVRASAFAAARAAACTIAAMAYDQELAERIRQLIGDDPELTEKKMFGGLAFQPQRDTAVAQIVRALGEGGGDLGWRQRKGSGVLPDVPVGRGVEHSPVLAAEQPAVWCRAVLGNVGAQDGHQFP